MPVIWLCAFDHVFVEKAKARRRAVRLSGVKKSVNRNAQRKTRRSTCWQESHNSRYPGQGNEATGNNPKEQWPLIDQVVWQTINQRGPRNSEVRDRQRHSGTLAGRFKEIANEMPNRRKENGRRQWLAQSPKGSLAMSVDGGHLAWSRPSLQSHREHSKGRVTNGVDFCLGPAGSGKPVNGRLECGQGFALAQHFADAVFNRVID